MAQLKEKKNPKKPVLQKDASKEDTSKEVTVRQKEEEKIEEAPEVKEEINKDHLSSLKSKLEEEGGEGVGHSPFLTDLTEEEKVKKSEKTRVKTKDEGVL